jgi:NAD(P)H-hydrate epimerase
MSILTGLSTQEIQANRIEIAEKFAREWGHTVVLKGAFTVIAAPGGETYLTPIASAALARAGSGDVLAGVIAGLLAQGMPGLYAAVCGAWIHGQAGLRAAGVLGSTASVLAGDLLQGLIDVMAEVSD